MTPPSKPAADKPIKITTNAKGDHVVKAAKSLPHLRLTTDIIEAIANKVATGVPPTVAAASLGIGRERISRWRTRGAQEEAGLRRLLVEAIEAAKARLVEFHVGLIRQSASDEFRNAKGDVYRRGPWTASAWMLERLLPDEFGQRRTVQGPGPGGSFLVAALDEAVQLSEQAKRHKANAPENADAREEARQAARAAAQTTIDTTATVLETEDAEPEPTPPIPPAEPEKPTPRQPPRRPAKSIIPPTAPVRNHPSNSNHETTGEHGEASRSRPRGSSENLETESQ